MIALARDSEMVMRNKTCLGIMRRTDVILRSWTLELSGSRRGKWFTYVFSLLRSKMPIIHGAVGPL